VFTDDQQAMRSGTILIAASGFICGDPGCGGVIESVCGATVPSLSWE
jgi:hypothetical protein